MQEGLVVCFPAPRPGSYYGRSIGITRAGPSAYTCHAVRVPGASGERPEEAVPRLRFRRLRILSVRLAELEGAPSSTCCRHVQGSAPRYQARLSPSLQLARLVFLSLCCCTAGGAVVLIISPLATQALYSCTRSSVRYLTTSYSTPCRTVGRNLSKSRDAYGPDMFGFGALTWPVA